MMWGQKRRDRPDDSPRVALLRDEVREVEKERRQGTFALMAVGVLTAWYFREEPFTPLPALLIVGLFLLAAVHQQLCGFRIDAYYREIRDHSPHLWGSH